MGRILQGQMDGSSSGILVDRHIFSVESVQDLYKRREEIHSDRRRQLEMEMMMLPPSRLDEINKRGAQQRSIQILESGK